MTQINMFEAKTKLSKIAKALEDGDEDLYIIARNGKPLLEVRLAKQEGFKLGAADGEFVIPDDFDDWDLTNDFEGEIFPR